MADNKLQPTPAKGVASYNSAFSNALTKGLQAEYIEPYVSGYYYLIWLKVPEFVDANFQEVMRVSNNSIDIPDTTLNTTEVVTGFAGSGKLTVVTSVETSSDVTIKFTELSGLPILNNIENWVMSIRDRNNGLSNIPKYKLAAYSGELLAVLTKPVLNDVKDDQDNGFIEKAFVFTYIYPTNIPYSTYNQDVTNSDKVEPSIAFKFSGMFTGEEVDKFAVQKLVDLKVMSIKDDKRYQ